MPETAIINEAIGAITGPFGALILSAAILYWLSQQLLPIIQKYLDRQNEKFEKMINTLDMTVKSHEKDRKVFESAILHISNRLEKLEDDVKEIKSKV